MILGQVVGNVVATIKDEALIGQKLLLIQLLNKELEPVGRPLAALDVAQAGPGDRVFLVRARDATLATFPVQGPVDLAIVGVVDSVPIADIEDPVLPFGESHYA